MLRKDASASKCPERILVRHLANRCLVYTSGAQPGQEMFAEIRKRFGYAATRLGRVVPATVMTKQHLTAQPSVQHPLDSVEQTGVGSLLSNVVVLDPRPAPGHFQVHLNVRLDHGVNPNESPGRAAARLDDIELVAHDTPANRVAANGRAGHGRRPRST